jgi:clan AA aspartic protease
MVTRVVNAALEATLRIVVLDTRGQPSEIETVVDTGFSGFLTLPPPLIAALALPWLCRQLGVLADGQVHIFDVYNATIIWDGQPRTVEVEAVDAQPLLGMALLRGHDLRVQVVPGGPVCIVVVP